MAAPEIDNLVLLAGRCLVLVDEGYENTGVLFRVSLQGFVQLAEGQHMPQDPENSPEPAIPYTHILFIKEGTTEVSVNGVEYLAMHQNNIIGAIPD